jgi:hypothetical protein
MEDSEGLFKYGTSLGELAVPAKGTGAVCQCPSFGIWIGHPLGQPDRFAEVGYCISWAALVRMQQSSNSQSLLECKIIALVGRARQTG